MFGVSDMLPDMKERVIDEKERKKEKSDLDGGAASLSGACIFASQRGKSRRNRSGSGYTDRIYGNESTGKDQYAGRRDKICQHIDPLHGYF